MAGIGPPPKPASKRLHHNPPANWGGATPVTAPAAAAGPRALELEDPVHQLVESMWTALQTSAEARFYSAADWERVRMELWHCNQLLVSGKPISPSSWVAVQHGLNALLISPAEKRRAAIELKATAVDSDEVAAVSMMSRYRDKLSAD